MERWVGNKKGMRKGAKVIEGLNSLQVHDQVDSHTLGGICGVSSVTVLRAMYQLEKRGYGKLTRVGRRYVYDVYRRIPEGLVLEYEPKHERLTSKPTNPTANPPCPRPDSLSHTVAKTNDDFMGQIKSLQWTLEEYIPSLEAEIKTLKENNDALYRQLNAMAGVFRKAKEIEIGRRADREDMEGGNG